MLVADQFEAVDEQAVLLAQRDGRPPALPAIAAAADVERGAENTDNDAALQILSIWIIFYIIGSFHS